MNSILKKIVLVIYVAFYTSTLLLGQSVNTDFGKNRVQYHDDFSDWWQYETQNFITYWYGKSRNIAIPTLQLAEIDHNNIQKLLEHKINDKIEIIVYLDISDLKQSNLGTEETFVNKTGETKIIGNKMFVYFDGNHQNLRTKVREGIARVYFNHMLFGSSFQEIIQNALLMNIPEWYKSGIVSYASKPWDYLIEDELRDIWHNNPKLLNFKKLSALHPRLAGHSFWYFIEQNYGKSAISNILYLTKISRGIENSFLYVLNEDIKQLEIGWEYFYNQYYKNEKGLFNPTREKDVLTLKKKGDIPVSQMVYNAKGNKLAYIKNNRGKYKVVIKDVKSGKEKKVFSLGFINDFQETDYNYPILCWHSSEDVLSICYEHKDILKIRRINIDDFSKEEQILPEALQRIYSVSFVDEDTYIFAGTVNGFSDLIEYKFKTRNYSLITNDYYDDLDPVFCKVKGVDGILFSSNREETNTLPTKYDTILPVGDFKIFFLPWNNNPSRDIELLTAIKSATCRFPMVDSNHQLTFLTNESGIMNVKSISLDTGESMFLTNADRNIIRYTVVPKSTDILLMYYYKGSYTCFKNKPNQNTGFEIDFTPLQQKKPELAGHLNKELSQLSKNTVILTDGFLFQTNFKDPLEVLPIPSRKESNVKENISQTTPLKYQNPIVQVHEFNTSRIIPANKRFSLHKVTTKFDNDILFEGLESYTGDRQQLLGTPMGFLFKATIKDLFEDYSIDVGTRLPLLLNGSEFFLVFDNKKSRIDKKMALYRKSQAYNSNDENQPISIAPSRSFKTSFIGLYQWKIPFNIYNSFRVTSQLRFDKYIRKSTENSSFNAPATTEQRLSVRCEYIFDNSHEESVNIKFGTRAKVYIEAINNFNVRLIDGFEFKLSQGFTTIIGYDVRHYVPLLFRSVLALRSAGAASFGSDKMLYYIGGMENWLFPSFNDQIPQRLDIDFAYKANIGQMRGFNNNIRNGTSYLLTNVELRVPFMQYILGKNKGSSFLRNMQVTGFFDMGTAWYGSSPYSKKNPLNAVVLESPPIIRLEVEYFKDPAVFGLGYGFRTQVFGYFIKFDYAWGIETGRLQKPIYYISLGQDF